MRKMTDKEILREHKDYMNMLESGVGRKFAAYKNGKSCMEIYKAIGEIYEELLK